MVLAVPYSTAQDHSVTVLIPVQRLLRFAHPPLDEIASEVTSVFWPMWAILLFKHIRRVYS